MKHFKCTVTLVLSLWGSCSFAQNTIENLYDETSRQTVLRQAGNYSAEHDVVTIAVKRGTAYRAQYDKYLRFLVRKFDSLNVPIEFFIEEHTDKPGTVFAYLIEDDLNGPFDGNELYALLPHIARRYRTQYLKR